MVTTTVSGQQITVTDLPDELREISGIELLDDSTLMAINDGGNDPKIFLLNFNGTIRRRINVQGVKNIDWEDLTRDNEYLYIADIGNNLNARKDLCILKVKLEDIRQKNEVKAQTIKIRYTEQNEFPPSKDSLFFDAESIGVNKDSLIIVTKCRTSPWNGNAMVYSVSNKPGEYTLTARKRLNLGESSWRTDSATGMDIHEGKWYVLTYGKLVVYQQKGEELEWEHTYKFKKFTQKESVVLTEDSIFVADEKHKLLGGGKLYRIDP